MKKRKVYHPSLLRQATPQLTREGIQAGETCRAKALERIMRVKEKNILGTFLILLVVIIQPCPCFHLLFRLLLPPPPPPPLLLLLLLLRRHQCPFPLRALTPPYQWTEILC